LLLKIFEPPVQTNALAMPFQPCRLWNITPVQQSVFKPTATGCRTPAQRGEHHDNDQHKVGAPGFRDRSVSK
jgi:hypothetical protein